MRRQHRDAELGRERIDRDMRDAYEREVVVMDAEHAVASEIDVIDVSRDAIGVERRAKAKTPVFGRQRGEVLLQRVKAGGTKTGNERRRVHVTPQSLPKPRTR